MFFLKQFWVLGIISGFIFFTASASLALTSQTLTLVINVPASSPVGSQFFFTAGPQTGCDWRSDCLPMKLIDPAGLTFSVQVALPANLKTLEFKITRGAWASEAADAFGHELQNQVIHLKGSSSLHVLNIIGWKDLPSLGVTGNVVDLGEVESPQLGNSREVYVWLPPSYSPESTKRYPVIYMHDGQNLFDPTKSSFGVDWDVDGAMTKIAKETGLEAIVVGAACHPKSISRAHEYDYAFKGAAYGDFLIKTLKPMIDSLYPTLTERESTFVGGSSMGAVISIELVWKHPEIFSKALAFSLPATVHKNSIFNLINENPTPQQPVQFYIDHGGWGEDANYKEGIISFIEMMKARGINSEQIDYAEFPYHDHTEADWSRRLESPLLWLLTK